MKKEMEKRNHKYKPIVLGLLEIPYIEYKRRQRNAKRRGPYGSCWICRHKFKSKADSQQHEHRYA